MKIKVALAKLIFLAGLVCVFVGVFLIRKTDIHSFVSSFLNSHKNIQLEEKNEYWRDYDFQFVKITDSFSPMSFQDIVNIYYTVLNSGEESFSFYCPKDYEDCIEDIQELANNQNMLSDINNFVHPYNGFSHIETEYDTLGRVTINVTHSYIQEDIQKINEKIDELYSQLVHPELAARDNIQAIHDYIINTTRYDSLKSEQDIDMYQSEIAYGPLFEGYAVCGGYTDLMALFLEKMNLKNFKVSSENHIWNAVEIEGNWYHIDLTWDDPVSADGQDYLEYTYFLIPTYAFKELAVDQHDFNENVYLELQ